MSIVYYNHTGGSHIVQTPLAITRLQAITGHEYLQLLYRFLANLF